MSDNWNPPPGRNPEPEPEGDQPTESPAAESARRVGQSPLWWTESAEAKREYLPGGTPRPPAPGQAPSGQSGWWQSSTPDRPDDPHPTTDQPRPQAAGPAPAGTPGQAPAGAAGQAPTGAPGQAPAGGSGWAPAGTPSAGPAAGQPTGAATGQRGPRHAGPAHGQPVGGPPPGPAQGGFQGQQPQTWQYPPIPIPQPPGSGRRRKPRQTSKGLLIGLVVLAVLVVGSGVTFALSRGGDDQVPTASETATSNPTDTTSVSPSPSPAQDDPVITASKLYAVGKLPATQCPEVKVLPATFTTARAYYTAMVPCMNRTWHAALQKAKLPFRGPKLAVYNGRINSACGIQNGSRSSYCDRNETIYLPYAPSAGVYRRNPLAGRVWMMNTLAHEYGHHVQKLAGISAASVARQEGWPEDQKLAESRRRELQAACFGSTYLGSAKASIPIAGQVSAAWQALVANTGDENFRPRIHARGSKASHKYWSTKGFSNPNPGGCNTFTAPDAQIS